MSADTRSTLLQLLLMGDGLHNSDWGDQTNTNLTSLEAAIAATDAIALTGTTLALSQAQNANAVLSFSGTLTGAFTLTVQATSKWWIVKNATSGAYTLTMTTGSGATVVVPQGQTLIVYCDGTNLYDVVNSAIPQLTSGTVLANTGGGPAAISFSAFLTALGLNTTQTPVFGGVNANGAAGTLRSILFSTVAAIRWVFGANSVAEGGANAGSNLSLDAYADDGVTLIGHAIIVTRSTMAVVLAGALSVAGALTNNGTQVRLGTCSDVVKARLTLTSATPIMTTTTSGQGTVYFTPFDGALAPYWNGSAFVDNPAFAEVSQATTDTSKSPAAATTNSNYDMFYWNDSGTFRCTRGPLWSSSTARGTGAGTTQLTRTGGFLVNQFAITNGPGAGAGLYVGTIRTNGSSLVDWTLAGSASGGTAGSYGVWNMFNRRPVSANVTDSTTGYNYSSSTVRQAHNSTGMQVSFVCGQAEDAIQASQTEGVQTPATFQTWGAFGIGLDSTSAFYGTISTLFTVNNAVNWGAGSASTLIPPQLGFHTISANESANGVCSFGQNSSPPLPQTRLDVQLNM